MKIQSAKAGIGTGRAGLQAASGLFSSAGLFDKGVKSFNPLDLDPYLLFDAQTSMIGTLENPTLDLDPSKQDTLDVITATRAGTATFTDANGLIASAPANTVRVDYTQGAELTPTVFQRVGYTDFSSGWSTYAYGGGSLTITSGYASPEGNNNALKLDLVIGTGGVLFTQNATILSSQSYTMSVWMKGEVGGEKVRIDLKNSQSNGVLGSVFTLTNEWQRYELTRTSDATNRGFQFRITASDNASDQTFYAYGPQLEEGTTASSFVANTTGSPKFITGATFGPRVPMILVEPSATNLVTYSEDFSQGNWNKNRVTVVDNSITSPDGSLNAVKLVETASTATHLTWTQATTTAAAHSFSVFAKAGERKRIGLRDNQIGNSAVFDLQSGSVISGSGGSIAQAANGFFRITLTGTYAAAGTRHEIYVLPDNATTANASYTGDGTSGVYIWGAQVEAGSVATSYIPTSGGNAAARTRAADDLKITGSDFDFYNQSEGTFYVETDLRTDENLPHIFEAYNSAATNKRTTLYVNSPFNRFGFYMQNIGTQANETIGAVNVGQLNRVAYSFKTNNLIGSVNGGTGISDTSASIPVDLNTLAIGNLYNGLYPLNGHIKRLIYWPYHSDSL